MVPHQLERFQVAEQNTGPNLYQAVCVCGWETIWYDRYASAKGQLTRHVSRQRAARKARILGRIL